MDLDELSISLINKQFSLNEVEDTGDRSPVIFSEDLVLDCIYDISRDVVSLMKIFLDNRHSNVFSKSKREKALSLLHEVLCKTLLLIHLGEVDIPEIDEIVEYAESFPLDVQHDGVLSCMTITSAISNFTMLYFDTEEITEDDYEQNMAEILAAISMIAERFSSNVSEVAAKAY